MDLYFSALDFIYVVAALFIILVFISCWCFIHHMRKARRMMIARNDQEVGDRTSTPADVTQHRTHDTLRQKLIGQFLDKLKSKKGGSLALKRASKMSVKAGKSPSAMCPICLEEYGPNHSEIMIGFLKNCGHYFHFDCIWTWLENKENCPICRENIKLTEEDIHAVALDQIKFDKSEFLEEVPTKTPGGEQTYRWKPRSTRRVRRTLSVQEGVAGWVNAGFNVNDESAASNRNDSSRTLPRQGSMQQTDAEVHAVYVYDGRLPAGPGANRDQSMNLARSLSAPGSPVDKDAGHTEGAHQNDPQPNTLSDDVMDGRQEPCDQGSVASSRASQRSRSTSRTSSDRADFRPILGQTQRPHDGVCRSRDAHSMHSLCFICKNRYHGDTGSIVVGFLSQCGHFYHFGCIDHFVSTHSCCPLCPPGEVVEKEEIYYSFLADMLLGRQIIGYAQT